MKILLGIAFIILSAASCNTTSLQPIATLDKMVTDDRVAGEWNGPKGNFLVEPLKKSALYAELSQSIFRRELTGLPDKSHSSEEKYDSLMEAKSYLLSFWQNGVRHLMMFRLVRLGGDLYGDLFPIGVKNAKGDDNYGFTLNHLSTHTLAKVAINDDATISLRPVAGDYVKSQLLAGNMNLRYEYDELFGSFVITASSEEMQQFIVKYGKSDRLFAADPVLLQKKN